ncbi:MAG: hypothetical protein P8X91_02015 [Candidatus Bathyarchaeota archaeon]|jgi:hypothetical protein
MKWSTRYVIGIPLISLFSIIFVVSFVIYPDIGEKILYGKHPPKQEKLEQLTYSEIILSGKYGCMESASIEAKGRLPKFIQEFNNCINQ